MKASTDKPGTKPWLKIAFLVSATLLTLLAYRAGSIWLGHACLILSIFLASWFVKPQARRLLRSFLIFISASLILATVFFQFLSTQERVEMTEATMLLVSIAAALVITGVFLAVTLLLATFISSEWILDMYETYGVTRRGALRLLFSTFFHTAYPSYTVENGEITNPRPAGLLPMLGGPGKVTIKPYNAVVFEQNANTTRIEGPGLITTKRFELPREIIDLRKQSIGWTTDRLLTKDHVPLTFRCSVSFRIESTKDTAKHFKPPAPGKPGPSVADHEGGRFKEVIEGDYRVYQHTLYRAAYGTTQAGWKLSTRGATETQLGIVVRGYSLSDLCVFVGGRLTPAPSAIDAIMAETLKRMQAISYTWGVTVTNFKITNFEAPEDIQAKLLEMWAAEYDSKKLAILSEGEATALLSRSEAEAEALRAFEGIHTEARQKFIDQILQGLNYGVIVSDAVADRFISAIEQISKNLVSDRVNATRYVEMLEKIAESQGTKTLVIGDATGLRGPGRGRVEDVG